MQCINMFRFGLMWKIEDFFFVFYLTDLGQGDGEFLGSGSCNRGIGGRVFY